MTVQRPLSKRYVCLLIVGLFFLNCCAGVVGLPGGNKTTNDSFYTTKEDLLGRLSKINPGMYQEEVFQILGRKEGDLERLTRQETLSSLFGTNNFEIRSELENQLYDKNFLQALQGYRLEYKVVRRKLGFSSPIRIRTDEKGFDYIVILIFEAGVLYEKPILTGGLVNSSDSKTFFDYLNPGTIMDRTLP